MANNIQGKLITFRKKQHPISKVKYLKPILESAKIKWQKKKKSAKYVTPTLPEYTVWHDTQIPFSSYCTVDQDFQGADEDEISVLYFLQEHGTVQSLLAQQEGKKLMKLNALLTPEIYTKNYLCPLVSYPIPAVTPASPFLLAPVTFPKWLLEPV